MQTKYVHGLSRHAISRGGWAKGAADWVVSRASAASAVAASQSCRNRSLTISGRTPTVPSSRGSIHGAGASPAIDASDSPASGITEAT